MSTTSSSRKRDASEAGLESTHEHGDKKQATNGTTVKQEDDENDADVILPTQELQRDSHGNIICPYLDTIDRKLLDFDFEKLCSVTLAHMNVYACLVCGKYFQGRGKKSHAYFHALEQDHHVFINLETEQIYCLPDGYQVIDSSLEDIRFNLHPRFTPTETKAIDAQRQFSHALDGTDYLPGTVGLNNIKSTDWLNVTVQALVRVPALRNFWLVDSNWKDKKSPLVKATGELMAKMCNPRSFKSHVSPHELLQAISATSNKRFRIGQQSDPLQFLSWYINTLHKEVGGTKKPGSSIVHQTFQGEIEITTQTPVKKGGTDEKDEKSKKKEDEEMQDEKDVEYTTSTNRTNFLYLSLALPSAPLFKDAQDRTLIPQIPLFDLLKKFDGQTIEYATGGIKRTYQITKLPRYLIIHAQRFQDNNWFTEKNPTLINFPLRNLDLRPYLKISVPTLEQLQAMNVAKLKEMAIKKNVNVAGALEKSELISKVQQAYSGEDIATRYDLIANIVHEGKPDKGTYKIHILQKATETWYEMQDLHVWTTETMPQLVALSETYIQIYERKQNTTTE